MTSATILLLPLAFLLIFVLSLVGNNLLKGQLDGYARDAASVFLSTIALALVAYIAFRDDIEVRDWPVLLQTVLIAALLALVVRMIRTARAKRRGNG